SVGMLQLSGGLGSGVLIGSQWVLTAAHVVSGTGGRHTLPSATFTLKGTQYTADYAEVYPTWSGNSGAGNDMALVHLTSTVSAISAAEFRIQPADLSNQYITFVGYGLGGDGQSGFVAGTGGIKRAGTNTLDYNGSILGLDSSIYLADFDSGFDSTNVLGSAAPTAFESILTPGDSGGGVFMLYNGQNILVGVNSFLASTTGTADGRYGNLGGFQAIGPNLVWVQSITQVPEPASLVLGVVCALVGWWAIERQTSKHARQQMTLANTKSKRIS
ncbi:MAG: trypsin-like serine peptidase, partial [Isosphaeraceae bacterium]